MTPTTPEDSMTTPSVTRNEAAERLRTHLAILRGRAVRQWMDGPAQYDVNEIDAAQQAADAALSEERRRTVERIRERLADLDGPSEFQSAIWHSEFVRILDEIGGDR